MSIELNVREDGQFAWDVNSDGHADSIIGEVDYLDGILTLTQEGAPPWSAKSSTSARRNSASSCSTVRRPPRSSSLVNQPTARAGGISGHHRLG